MTVMAMDQFSVALFFVHRHLKPFIQLYPFTQAPFLCFFYITPTQVMRAEKLKQNKKLKRGRGESFDISVI